MAAPILQSLLLADHIYRDQATGKHVICGVFSTIFFTPNQPTPNQPTDQSGHRGDGGRGNGGGSESGGGGGGAGGGFGGSADQSPFADRQSVPGEQQPKSQPIQNLMQAGSPYVYFSVTELKENKVFQVRYVDLHENRSLFQADVAVECDDPLKTIEISLPLPRLPLVALEERAYALEVLCEGQLLGSHRVLARVTPGANPPST